METVFDVLAGLRLGATGVLLAGCLLFVAGFLLGHRKAHHLRREKHGLEKAVMELNEELLYGALSKELPERHTPVIDLKQKSYKSPQLAK